jgi:hypothetical protein
VKCGTQEIHVIVDNPDAVSAGVATASLNGKLLDSARIPLDPHGVGTLEVYVRLGSSARRTSSASMTPEAPAAPLPLRR